jgi:hypothetical protein
MNPTVALIPSAYKIGLVYSILPASGRGDFNFNRPSSATRVNKDGLVEEMSSNNLGNELVVNGDFSDGLNGWSSHVGSTLELENGMAKVTTVNSQGFIKRTDLSIETGKTYFCKAYITNALAPQWFLNSANNPINLSLISENTYGGYVTVSGNNPYFYIRGNGTSGEVSYIDNVSIKEVISNVPRLDYTNGNCPQLLLEPQSENLALYSGDLTNAEWEPFGNVVVTGGYIAPDGTNSAVKVSCDNIVSNSVLIQQSIGNSTRSRTIYARTVKTGTTGIANLCSYHGNNNNEFTITDQWQRFEVNGTSTGTGQSDFYAIDFRGTTDLDEILLWGAQIENLTYATSYIPTEATTVTRSRDLMTDSMASRPEITSDDWTLFLDFNKSDLGSDNCVSINDGTNDNSIVINNRADDELAFILNQGGTVLSSYIYDITGIDDLKVSFSSTDTGASMVVNGVEIDRLDDGRFDASSLIQIDFTEYGTTNEFAGRVNDFRYYNVALSLNETIALTK